MPLFEAVIVAAIKIKEVSNLSFKANGFLGEQIKAEIQIIYNRNKTLFDFTLDFIKFALEIEQKIELSSSNNIQQILTGLLYGKIINSIQSAYILSKHGLTSDGRVVLRGALEATFILRSICLESDFASKYVETTLQKKLKLINSIYNSKEEILKSLRDAISKEGIGELQQTIEDGKIKDFSALEIATKTGLEGAYQTMYRMLSEEVHTSPHH
jgi:hypothetical protein